MRISPAVALTASLTLGGCYAWTPVSQEALRAGRVEVRTRSVRFDGSDENVVVAHRVDRDGLEGWDEALLRERRVDLTTPWRSIEARRPDRGATAVTILASTLGLGPIIFLAVLVGAGSTR